MTSKSSTVISVVVLFFLGERSGKKREERTVLQAIINPSDIWAVRYLIKPNRYLQIPASQGLLPAGPKAYRDSGDFT
ncbi:hypothetical protein EV361DRAFT_911951 [Lentinula raphanica]|nr:hypothetical protein EV361DRAFT_911951 [Lentinula raphanica]